jgi:hypothetical protein
MVLECPPKKTPQENIMRTQCICLALAIVLICPFASAQWKQMGLSDRAIAEVAISTTQMFAVTA